MTNHDVQQLANNLRYWILQMTTKAGSGHVTSSLSAADLLAVVAAHYFHYEINQPENMQNDRLIFSKGHATPLYYAFWHAIGGIEEAELWQYRQFDSHLEGHPTPRFPHTLVATGSLGMGLGFGVGIAEGLLRHRSLAKVWVILGDGELAEGSVGESLALAAHRHLSNLVALVDVNRLGQSRETMMAWDMKKYEERFKAYGWKTVVVDGHNIDEIDAALEEIIHNPKSTPLRQGFAGRVIHNKDLKISSQTTDSQPIAILAKTIKGKGISFLEDAVEWHGKALSLAEMERAKAELEPIKTSIRVDVSPPAKHLLLPKIEIKADLPTVPYPPEKASLRQAVGQTLAALAQQNDQIIVIDGDVSNSTFTHLAEERCPDQFIEGYIAEQQMVETAVGLQTVGYRPVVATFAAFWTRAFDQLRMATVGRANLCCVGTHAGVAVGYDGPSQMGLEDVAMMRTVDQSTIIAPADAISAQKLLRQIINSPGISYLRVIRGEVPIIYSDRDQFTIGGSKILHRSDQDVCTVIASGTTVHEALKAYDQLKERGIFVRVIDLYSIKPLDQTTLKEAARQTKRLITVEDHWVSGGLGDAVLDVFADSETPLPLITKLGVRKMPRSGSPEELLDYEGISANSIVETVKKFES